MFLLPVTESEVEKVVKGFKNKLSTGIDEIPDNVVKKVHKTAKETFSQHL